MDVWSSGFRDCIPDLVSSLRHVLLEETEELRVLEVAVLVDLSEQRLEQAIHPPRRRIRLGCLAA